MIVYVPGLVNERRTLWWALMWKIWLQSWSCARDGIITLQPTHHLLLPSFTKQRNFTVTSASQGDLIPCTKDLIYCFQDENAFSSSKLIVNILKSQAQISFTLNIVFPTNVVQACVSFIIPKNKCCAFLN